MLFSRNRLSGVLTVLALLLTSTSAVRAQTTTPATATETETFSMILASDPQFPFATRDDFLIADPNGETIPGRTGRFRRKTDAEVENESRINNANHAISMILLAADQSRNVKGIIMNGDLSNNGAPPQLNVFQEFYHQIPLPIYIGLGNHDYANYVEPWGYTNPIAVGNNWGGAASVQYMMQRVSALGIQGDNFDRSGNAIHIKGSLAYSWDVGNVHFVQLHNYPLYQISFVGVGLRYDLNICLNWLERDLQRARAAGKYIILNFHDSNEHWGDFLSDEQTRLLTDMFRRLITQHGVSAVFCGHYHSIFSRRTGTDVTTARRAMTTGRNATTKEGWMPSPNGFLRTTGAPTTNPVNRTRLDIYGNIPLFYCGSASWSRFLLVEFNQDQQSPQMTVTTINSSSGQPVPEGTPVSVTLRTQ